MSRKITHAELTSLLHYDPYTGVFSTVKSMANGIQQGTVMGGPHEKGYIRICLWGKNYFAHRLAWFYIHKRWPLKTKMIDHIDGDRQNNRIENLRVVSNSQNQQNQRGAPKRNTHGWLGACLRKQGWATQIVINGSKKIWGYFEEPEPAHLLYLMAKKEFHISQTSYA